MMPVLDPEVPGTAFSVSPSAMAMIEPGTIQRESGVSKKAVPSLSKCRVVDVRSITAAAKKLTAAPEFYPSPVTRAGSDYC